MDRMVAQHELPLWGSRTAMIISTTSTISDPFLFIRCLRKGENGQWERPSQGEGKNIKLSLGEMISVLAVAEKHLPNWSTVHKYRDQNNTEHTTVIGFQWGESNESNTLWIAIADYRKAVMFPETDILARLLRHIITEKIEFGTIPVRTQGNGDPDVPTFIQEEPSDPYQGVSNAELEDREQQSAETPQRQAPKKSTRSRSDSDERETTTIRARIVMERAKALLLGLTDSTEKWFPKSTIESEYDTTNPGFQDFEIQNWVLIKNGVPQE